MFETINRETREALEDPKTSTANEAGPLMAFPRTPSCGGASPRSVGASGAAQIVQPLSDPSPPLGPLSCARGELARTGAERHFVSRPAASVGNRIYYEI